MAILYQSPEGAWLASRPEEAQSWPCGHIAKSKISKQALPCRPVGQQHILASSPPNKQTLPRKALLQSHLSARALSRSQMVSKLAVRHLLQETPS